MYIYICPNQQNPRNLQGQHGSAGKPNVFKQNSGFGSSGQVTFLEPSNRGALFPNTSKHKPLGFQENTTKTNQNRMLF